MTKGCLGTRIEELSTVYRKVVYIFTRDQKIDQKIILPLAYSLTATTPVHRPYDP